MTWIDILGYVGMAFIIISFLFKNSLILRSVNTIGSALSATYGFLIAAYPTGALNSILTIINVVFLIIYFINKSKKVENNEV